MIIVIIIENNKIIEEDMACSPAALRNAVTPLADELGKLVAPEKAQQVQENQDMLSGKRKAKQQKSFRSCNRTIPQKYKAIEKIKDKLREAGHSEDAELPYGFWLELKK